jgi:DNA polymerase elongation subunit (family B)
MSVTVHLFDAIAQDIWVKGSPQYVIHCFGTTSAGKTIRLSVKNFQPFFYVALPAIKGVKDMKAKFEKHLLDVLEAQEETSTIQVTVTEMKKNLMYGYTGGQAISVVELRVNSRKDFYALKRLFLDDRSKPIFQLFKDTEPLRVFDALLDPMLRWFHIQNIAPCGWVTAPFDSQEEENGILISECDWDEVKPELKPPMPSAPFLTNFWDIECYSASGDFPVATKGDPIIQIGNVLVRQGFPTKKIIFVLGTCDPVPGAEVIVCKTEKDMLKEWAARIEIENPDIYVGYNTFGFDEKYVYERVAQLWGSEAIKDEPVFKAMNRLEVKKGWQLETKFLSSSALGDNYLYMWTTAGRLQIDLYHYIRRSASLPSYKLDAVCQYYMSGKLKSIDTHGSDSKTWTINTKSTGDVVPGRYIMLLDETGEAVVEKIKVVAVEDKKSLTVEAPVDFEDDLEEAVNWAVVKDDVPPQEIFRLHREGGKAGRAKVAAYCIQDCDLVYELYKKLDVFNNSMSMANVCSVPITYIFTRGQGIKIESLIFKECRERNIIVEVQDTPSRNANVIDDDEPQEDSYEGAIVLDPEPGFYSDSPIGVCDFASLYPSTIISEDISHDSLVWVKEFDMQGKFTGISFGSVEDEKHAPPGTRWTDIEFDILRPDPKDKRKQPVKIKDGFRICRYAQKPDFSKHTLPDIVAKLLAARKAKRKEAEKETDPFRKALLDAEQLAYKLTANSLYGQLGSATFKVRLQHLAASVTAYGRKQILFAKAAIEQFYGPQAKDPRCCARVIYGDTDSLFVDFGVKDEKTGCLYKGTEAIQKTIDITEEAGKFVSAALKAPHDFEYDKVFDQFIIFSKKRYVGNKYEESATEFKQTSMGIVLKRRDNAPVLKTIYGGAIKILLNERDVPKAAAFVTAKTLEMVEGKMSLGQLTITKSLSAKYKKDYVLGDIKEARDAIRVFEAYEDAKSASEREKLKKTIATHSSYCKTLAASKEYLQMKLEQLEHTQEYPAHKILADRMKARDPGNAPASGDRLGFVFIAAKSGQQNSALQGDRIETPDYIRQHNLEPDYKYYIERQLMNPIGQLFGIMVEKIPGYKASESAACDAIASELLFKKALVACDAKARNNFIKKVMGGSVTVVETSRPVTRSLTTGTATAQQMKQGKIDSYFIHKEFVKEYKKSKKAASTEESKPDKQNKK